MSNEIINYVLENSNTKGSKRLLLLVLANTANDNGVCWPSITTLSKRTKMSRRYTINLLNELEEEGEIEIKKRKKDGMHTSNLYTVVVNPASLPSEPRLTTPSEPEITTGSEPELTGVVNPASLKPLINHQLEPSINGGSGEKKSLGDDKTAIHGNLLDHFAEITCLLRPENSSLNTQSLWWDPIKHIAELTSWDEGKAKQIISKAVTEMDNRKLTISTPKSILKTAQAVFAKDKRGSTVRSGGMPGVFIGPDDE